MWMQGEGIIVNPKIMRTSYVDGPLGLLDRRSHGVVAEFL